MSRLIPFLLASALLAGCSDEPPRQQAETGESSAHSVISFTLPDLEGEQQSLEQWQGQVVMVNFWAPWCPPCREEVPAFIELQEKYADKGFTIVGITVDTHENAQTFADTMGINYPVLIAEEEGIELAKKYGNKVGALPFTALLDRSGNIVFTHRNELTLEQAEEALQGVL